MAKARIPGPESVSGQASIRPPGGLAAVDNSGFNRGVQNLATGLQDAGASLAQVGRRETERQNTSDFAKAEAAWLTGSMDIANRYAEDGDWRTFDTRVTAESQKIKDEAGALIRNGAARQQWLNDTELKRIAVVDAVNDRGRRLSHEEDRVTFGAALDQSARMSSDPGVPESVRVQAREDIESSINTAVEEGLLSPAEGAQFRKVYIDKADEQLSRNLAALEIEVDPDGFMSKVGISSLLGATDVSTATIAASNGLVKLDPTIAREAATSLGMNTFPDDPKLAAAFITDPEINEKLTLEAMDILTTRYDGDVTAAIIAMSPGGGTALADEWVTSGHDESILPEKVRKHYRDVTERMAPERELTPIPIMAEPGVDLASVDVAVMDMYEQVQTTFGSQQVVISGFRDPEHNKAVGGAEGSQHINRRALDVDVSNLSKEERIRFIETASTLGFTGIGVYNNTLHLDTGPRRSWGPKDGAVPGWAREITEQHNAGAIIDAPLGRTNVAPEYRALDFDERLQLYGQAKSAKEQQSIDSRAGIEIAAANAPAAISAHGEYTGYMPSVNDFVAAYGAEEGVQKFQAFSAAVEVSEVAYGWRTTHADDIAATLEQYTPTSTGPDAAVEIKRFETLQAAAMQTIKARNADPAGYAFSVFPEMQAAWEDIEDDPSKFSAALTQMAEAQAVLGIEEMALLPDQMSDNVAATFNNKELSSEERVGSVAQIVMATPDEEQQAAIFDQLVASGVPAYTRGAMDALARGDTGAANRLFRAAMVDPKDLPGQLPDNIKPSHVNERIQALMFDENRIGDILYGISDGTAENFDQASIDATLIERAVKLRLIDGSANGVDDAVSLTIKDMFGDMKVVTGHGGFFGVRRRSNSANLKIVIPSEADETELRQGFNALLQTVRASIFDDLSGELSSVPGQTSDLAIMERSIEQRTETILNEGYFTMRGDDYVFIDPMTGQAIPDEDGGDLVFTNEQVLQAGVEEEVRVDSIRSGGTPIVDEPEL